MDSLFFKCEMPFNRLYCQTKRIPASTIPCTVPLCRPCIAQHLVVYIALYRYGLFVLQVRNAIRLYFQTIRILASTIPCTVRLCALTSQAMYCAAPSCVHNLVSLWTLCSLSAKCYIIACTLKQKEFRLLPSRVPSDYALTSQAMYCAAPSCVHSLVSLWTLCSLSVKCHSIVLSNNKKLFFTVTISAMFPGNCQSTQCINILRDI